MQARRGLQVHLTLVFSYADAAQEATALASFSILAVDFEGESLGHRRSSLMLLSICIPHSSRICLVDVLSLHEPDHPSLKQLLALLWSDKALRVFWDEDWMS